MQAARPFIKWAGGKTQLLPALMRHIPAQFRCYHEPFIGSAALFLYLEGKGHIRHGAVLSDANPALIELYTVVRDNVSALIEALQEHEVHKHSRDYYYAVRSWDRSPDWSQRSPVERAARMILLNKTCFNGLHRVNRQGYFNVPFGRYGNPTICDTPALHAVSSALQGVDLIVDDFAGVLERARPQDLIYFDPPYLPLSATASFTSYTHTMFGVEQHQRLAYVFVELAERGCSVILSNSSVPLVHELYSGFEIDEVPARRAINSVAGKRGPITELIVHYSSEA
jgi:DNA adenine methylase